MCYVNSGADEPQNTFLPEVDNCVGVEPLGSVYFKRTHDIA